MDRGVRQWFARLWVFVFALSYSAAALAAHCQAHFSALVPTAVDHDHHHGDHHPTPMQQNEDDCASMAWEKMLGPGSAIAAPAPSGPSFAILPAVSWVAAALNAKAYDRAAPRPPPDSGPRTYAAHFMRTGRMLI